MLSCKIREVLLMVHNMTVTVEDNLWDEMQRYPEIRWGTVMKQATRQKLEALIILEQLSKKSHLSEEEIKSLSVKIGKKITGRK